MSTNHLEVQKSEVDPTPASVKGYKFIVSTSVDPAGYVQGEGSNWDLFSNQYLFKKTLPSLTILVDPTCTLILLFFQSPPLTSKRQF